MKSAFAFLLLLLAALACGCTGTAAPPAGASPSIPLITGTWAGTMNGYDRGTGFNGHPNGTVTLTVTEQHGRVFAGTITVVDDTAPVFSAEVAGVIGRDGRSLTVVEESGYCTGEITGPDTIELVYGNDAAPFTVAIDTFRRVA